MLRSEFEARATREISDNDYNEIEFVYNWYPSDNMDKDTIAYIFNRLGMRAIDALRPIASEYFELKKEEEDIIKKHNEVSARIGRLWEVR